MTTEVHVPIDHDLEDELISETIRVEMIQAERWELTELGRQHQQERQQCGDTPASYEPIDVACLRCGAAPGSVCTSTHKTRSDPFPQMHAVRVKLASVAHCKCPVEDCSAGVGQPCMRVTGPSDERGTPQRAVHYRREHGEDAAWGAHH